MPSVCFINHIFSSILFPLATHCSISHCSTPPFIPSHPVVVMVNSISHTPLTHPHRAPATSIRALIHLRERAASALPVWLRGEVKGGEKGGFVGTDINAVPQSNAEMSISWSWAWKSIFNSGWDSDQQQGGLGWSWRHSVYGQLKASGKVKKVLAGNLIKAKTVPLE